MTIPDSQCPTHLQPATQTCARCGSFLCERCEISTVGWCRPCWEGAAKVRASIGALESVAWAAMGVPLVGCLGLYKLGAAGARGALLLLPIGGVLGSWTLWRAYSRGFRAFYVHALISLILSGVGTLLLVLSVFG